MSDASTILKAAAETIQQRAQSRDTSSERSMARTVATFNALTGHDLTESDGWAFMVLLKMARAQVGFNPDDMLDAAAYCALKGECDAKPETEATP